MEKNGPISTPETPRKAADLLIQLLKKAGEREVPDDLESRDEAQRAYRRVAQKFHPDKAPDNPHADRYMAQANLAWALLDAYDGHWPIPVPTERQALSGVIVGPTGQPVQPGPRHHGGEMHVVVDVVDVDLDTIFNELLSSARHMVSQLPQGFLAQIFGAMGMAPPRYPGGGAPRFVFGQQHSPSLPFPFMPGVAAPPAHHAASPHQPVAALPYMATPPPAPWQSPAPPQQPPSPFPGQAAPMQGMQQAWACPYCGTHVPPGQYHDCKNGQAPPPQQQAEPTQQQQIPAAHQAPAPPPVAYANSPYPQAQGTSPAPPPPPAPTEMPPQGASAPPAPRHHFVVEWNEFQRWAAETQNGATQGAVFGHSVGPNGQASAAGNFLAWMEHGQLTIQGTPHQLVTVPTGSGQSPQDASAQPAQ